MIKFRGTTKEGKVVEGYWFRAYNDIRQETRYVDYIIEPHVFVIETISRLAVVDFTEVLPSSLAMYTGINDKNKVPIYGSFPVDGVMGEGGDEIMAVDEKRRVMWYFNRWVMRVIGTNCLREFHKNNICFYEVIPKQEAGDVKN